MMKGKEIIYSEPWERASEEIDRIGEIRDIIIKLKEDKAKAQYVLAAEKNLSIRLKDQLERTVIELDQYIQLEQSNQRAFLENLIKLNKEHEKYVEMLEKFKPTQFN